MRALVVAFVVAAIALVACEAFVPSDVPAFTCVGSDPSVCPPDQYCSASRCVPCDPQHCGDGASPEGGGDDATGDAPLGDDAAGDSPATNDGAIDAIDAPRSDGADASTCTAGSAALGCACTMNSDCASHICGTALVLSASFTGGSVCTETCCTSADCPAGFVCYGAATGGNYCVRASSLSRADAPSGAAPGATCSAPGDCRSGACTAGHCLDTCCSDAGCASPTICALTAAIDGHTSFVCTVHAGAARGASCSGDSACASGVCAFSTCRPRCCGRASALAVGYHACALDANGSDVFAFGDYPSGDASGGDFGTSCTADTQCKTRTCDLAGKTCSDVCCLDADCAGYGAGFVCRPAQAGPSPLTTLRLLCVQGP